MLVSWAYFKNFVDTRNLNIQGIETSEFYYLKARDSFFELECSLNKNPTDDTDLDDFETNYKPTYNRKLEQLDNELRPYYRQVVTLSDWYYSPRSFDFYSSKYKSLYNRKHYHDPSNTETGATIDGSLDIGDAWLEFFDATNTQIVIGETETDEEFQARLDSNCVKTTMSFEPNFSYDVVGAKVQFRNVPSDRAYFWVVLAPDIPEEYGGSVVFMGGGMNISFFGNQETFECDGKSVARVNYDPDYHSGKMSVILKHNVGVQIGMQFILQFYS